MFLLNMFLLLYILAPDSNSLVAALRLGANGIEHGVSPCIYQ